MLSRLERIGVVTLESNSLPAARSRTSLSRGRCPRAWRWIGRPHGKRASLAPCVFLRRSLDHPLPPGFVRIRHDDLLASAHVHAGLARAREQQDIIDGVLGQLVGDEVEARVRETLRRI